jgi:hypothetical protein
MQKHVDQESEEQWNVMELKPVPFAYPMKRGFREIRDSTLKELFDRINNCLRNREIEAEYDNINAVVKCTKWNTRNSISSLTSTKDSMDGLKFTVRMFQGNKDDSIITHVHRLSGCGFLFKDECLAILDAADR